jgi:DNA repair exonuclease SbcCD ATPase subunit
VCDAHVLVQNYESRLEALRVRAEEASSDVGGDSQAKLLRQIETLQTQYSLAAENWRTIETSLNGRISAIEKERDEATKREAEVRKKARDISSKAKRFEEQIEQLTEESQQLISQLQASKTETKKLQSRLETAETSLSEAKTDLDRQKQSFETELSQKLEEERTRQLSQGLGIGSPSNGPMASRTQSPTSYFRKQPAQDVYGSVQSRRGLSRIPSQEQTPTLSIDRSVSRRPSTLTPGLITSRTPMTPDFPSPSVSRQGSMFSLAQLINGNNNNGPQTPSIHTTNDDADDGFDNRSSPQRTINDVISASTVHTGPSVQLVQHMSSKIQRLEAEKSATKDEVARLVAQRDEARDEVVSMMREIDTKRSVDGKTEKLDQELKQVKQRYEACLQMFGEKEEEVEELKSDLVEVKKMYRELVDRNMK